MPNTMLLSNQFITRAFGVWGHNLVAGLIVAVPIWIVIGIIALLVGIR
jgi:uncharacterized membrane protein